MSHLHGPLAKYGAVGLAGMSLVGMAASASAEGRDEDDQVEAHKTTMAKPTPMKLLHASMIADARDRAKFQELVKKRVELRKKEQTQENQEQLKKIDEQLKPLNEQYGTSIVDPHDFNYASLYGHLPDGKQPPVPNPGRLPTVTKAKPAEKKPKAEEDEKESSGSSWLDYASMGLAGASMIPGLGTIAGGLGTAVDLARGDYLGAGLSAASMLPFAGSMIAGGKLAKLGIGAGKASKIAGGMNRGASIARAADFGLPALLAGTALYNGQDQEVDTATREDDRDVQDFTKPIPIESKEVEMLRKMMEQSQDQNRLIASLLVQLNKVQEDNAKLMARLVTTRP